MSEPTWKTVLDIVKIRRSYYALKNSSTLTNAELTTILKDAVNHCPTPFNSQSTRAALVVGPKNREMWETLWATHKETLTGAAPEAAAKAHDRFENAFIPSYGTYIFFSDIDVVSALVEKMPHLHEAFPAWVGNADGILQSTVWNAIEVAGMGANLQHLPQVSPKVVPVLEEFLGTPKHWKVTAMLPFGEKVADANPRTYLPIDNKVLVIE